MNECQRSRPRPLFTARRWCRKHRSALALMVIEIAVAAVIAHLLAEL